MSIEIPSAVVLCMSGVSKTDRRILRVLAQIYKSLKTIERPLIGIGVKEDLRSFLKTNGLDGIIKFEDKLEVVLERYKPQLPKMPPRIDVDLINPFIEGALKTLEVQCSSAAKASKPYLKSKGPVLSSDIAALIYVDSDMFKGTVALHFPKQTFLSILGKMFKQDVKELNDTLESNVSEFLNVIYGQAKRTLNQKGYGLDSAIPKILHGEEIKKYNTTSAAAIVLPFESDLGPFYLEVAAAVNP
jgi:chemotaxis protein CheX